MKPRTPHDDHMDALLQRASKVFDGEKTNDLLLVCAALIGHAIQGIQVDEQRTVLEKTIAFIIENAQGKK